MAIAFGESERDHRLSNALATARALYAATRHTPWRAAGIDLVSSADVHDRIRATQRYLIQLSELVRHVDVACGVLSDRETSKLRAPLLGVVRTWRSLCRSSANLSPTTERGDESPASCAKRLRTAARLLHSLMRKLSQRPTITISSDERKWARGGAIAKYGQAAPKRVSKAQVLALLELGRKGKCSAPYKAISAARGLIELLQLPDDMIQRKGPRKLKGKTPYEAPDLMDRVVDHREFDSQT